MTNKFIRGFFPHKENDYWPHILRQTAMAAMLFLVLLSFMVANIQALLWVNVDWLVSAVLPAVIVEKTNTERATGDLSTLKRNKVLDEAAQLKANDMAKNSYFAHYSPAGISPWYWFNQVGYEYVHAGENLAVHFKDSGEVVKAWMASPTHRANIMNGNFSEIGIGIAEGKYEGYDTIFVVQLFGTPSITTTPTENKMAAAEPVSEPSAIKVDNVLAANDNKEQTKEAAVAEPATATDHQAVVDFSTVLALAPAEEPIPDTKTTEPTAVADEDIDIEPTDTNTTTVAMIDEKQAGSTSPVFAAGSLDKVPNWLRPWLFLTTEPLVVLQFFYVALAVFVAIILMISVVWEWRRHHPVQVIYSGGLIAVMIGLFYLHTIILAGATVV